MCKGGRKKWNRGERGRRSLEGFGEFFGESAGLPLRTTLLRTFVLLASPLAARRTGGRATGLGRLTWGDAFGPRRLGLVGPQQTVFQRSTIKAADDEIHLFRIRRVDECESLRFLSLGVADHFDVVEDKVFCVQPGLDVVLRNPDRQISKKYSEAHSVCMFNSVVGDLRELLRG